MPRRTSSSASSTWPSRTSSMRSSISKGGTACGKFKKNKSFTYTGSFCSPKLKIRPALRHWIIFWPALSEMNGIRSLFRPNSVNTIKYKSVRGCIRVALRSILRQRMLKSYTLVQGSLRTLHSLYPLDPYLRDSLALHRIGREDSVPTKFT